MAQPKPGSLEYALHATGLARMILDLRLAKRDDPASAWLTHRRPMRSIGAVAMEDQFSKTDVRKAYDAIIYFDRTTASRLLKSPQDKHN